MKMTILPLLALTALSSTAFSQQKDGIQKSAAIHALQFYSQSILESTQELEEEVAQYTSEYRKTSRFALRSRIAIGDANCVAIKGTLGANLLILATTMESGKEHLKDVPELNSDLGKQKLDLLRQFTQYTQAASKNCSIPTKSHPYVRSALLALTEATQYFQTIPR